MMRNNSFTHISGPRDLFKILFRFYSNVLEEETVETLWAEAVNEEYGYYRLDNIPFYIPEVAIGDVVWAAYSKAEEMLTYRKTIEYSGNSTVHAIITDSHTDIDKIAEMFTQLGCKSEKLNQRYFALNVPAAVDYEPVNKQLNELRKGSIIDYAESCLSEKHH